MSNKPAHVLHLLSDYVDALLPEQEHLAVVEHVKGCAPCGKHFQEIARLRKIIQEQPMLTVPAGFYSTIVQKIKEPEKKSAGWTVSGPFKLMLAISVLLAVVWWRMGDLMQMKKARITLPLPVMNSPTPIREMPLVDQKIRGMTKVESAKDERFNAPAPPITQPAPVSNDVVTSTLQAVSPALSLAPVVSVPVKSVHQAVPKPVKPPTPKAAAKSSAGKPHPKVVSKTVKKSTGKITSTARKPAPAVGIAPLAPVEKTKVVEWHTESTPSAAPTELVEWRGLDSGIRKFRTYVIDTPEQMQNLWLRHSSKTPVPIVDFERYQVVGISTGQTHDAAKGFELMGTRTSADALIVYYRESKNMFRSESSLSTFRPYHFKVIPRTMLPIKFQQI